MNRGSFRLIVLVFLLTISCRNREPVIDRISGFTQGTTYSIAFDNNININPAELQQRVEKVFADFDMSLSLYKDSSLICRVNRNENVVLDTFFTEVFKKSVEIANLTGGAFDITVGPLVKAWGFGPDEHKKFPVEKHDSLMNLVGMNKVSIADSRLVKSDPAINLDVNAIAQGYSVDVICRLFDGLGLKNYLVEIGGEVRARGKKGKSRWKIGIDRPVDNNMSPGQDLEAIIQISDMALATSGNYRKFYVENGIKYSHTIDPHTGYPARNTLLSATILASECATADGIATACMVMGKDEAVKFIENHPDYSAFLVYSDEKGNYATWSSESLRQFITTEDNELK